MSNPLTASQALARLKACQLALDWVQGQEDQSPEALWSQCPRADWLLWVAWRAGVPHDTLAGCALEIAESVLHLVPPGDPRPGEALRVTRDWLQGEAIRYDIHAAAHAAYKAYHEAQASPDAGVRAASLAIRVAAYVATAVDFPGCRSTYPDSVFVYAADAAAAVAGPDNEAEARRSQERLNAEIVRRCIPYHAVSGLLVQADDLLQVEVSDPTPLQDP